MNVQNLNSFARFWALGYRRLCPVTPPQCPLSERSSLHRRMKSGRPEDDARGKAPGVKWPDGTWSGFDFVKHESTEADIERWHEMGAGVGVKTGLQHDGTTLLMIDADTMDPHLAVLIEQTLERDIGHLPKRIGRAPKAGYLVRVPGEFPYARVEFGERDDKGRLKERVEILGEGRQFANGVHPTTMKPYVWIDGLTPFEDVPIVESSRILAVLETLRPLLPAASPVIREGAGNDVPQETLRGSLEAVTAAVRATPNTSDAFPSREAYRDYGYAIKAALPDNPDEAFDLFREWCDRWTDGSNPGDVVASDWARMKPPFRRGASWLYEMAETHSGGAFNRATAWLESETEAAEFRPEDLPNLFGSPERKHFTFETMDQAADRALEAGAEPLIDGLLDQGAMTVLYGDSNSGKTFVAMDMAYHIATGRPWAGMSTAGLPVVYIAAEGGSGFRKRVAALRLRYGSSSGFHVLVSPVDLRRPDADLEPLIAAIRALGPIGLGVLDTLSRIIAGGDENSSVDMGALVKNLDRLRSACGCHVLVVHHTGKDAARGARGHSLLRAATDTEIEIRDREIAVRKQRDLEGEWASGFDLKVVEIGRDPRGRMVTSCVIGLVDAAARAVVEADGSGEGRALIPPTRTEREVLHVFDAVDSASAADVVLHFTARNEIINLNAARHHLKVLTAKGWLQKAERGHWTKFPKTPLEVAENASATLRSGGRSGGSQNGQVAESGGPSGGNAFA